MFTDDEIYDDGESMQLPQQNNTQVNGDRTPPQEAKVAEKPKPKSHLETYFYGMWDCMASTENELAFKPGDLIEVLERRYDTEGWWVGKLDSKIGLVPKSYLSPAYKLVQV